MDTPAWYRPSTPETRSALFTCPECKVPQKGLFYLRLSEPHPDLADFAFKKRNRKKILDLRACRFCHLKRYKREQEARLRAKQAEARRAAYEQAVARGEEITDERLIPPEARPPRTLTRTGYDPVLLYCKAVLKHSRSKRAEVLRKAETVLALRAQREEGVHGSVTTGNTEADDPALTFLKYQYKLYEARIAQALTIRERRRRDLQSLATASDPVRLNWSAYVTASEKAKLVRAARRANQHRVSIILAPDKKPSARLGARPFTWMPDFSFGLQRDADRKVVAMAWADHMARAKNTQAKAVRFVRYALNRDPLQERARSFTPRAGTRGPFTMVEFYRALNEAAGIAIDRIEQAIEMGMAPTNYTLTLDDDERMVVTHWEHLVPMHFEELRIMRTGFDDETNNRIDPFSRLFVPRVLRSQHSDDPTVQEQERAQRRTRKQMRKGLDYNGLPLPIPAPAMESQ